MGWDTFKAQLWLLAMQPGCGPVGVARLPEGRLHRGGPCQSTHPRLAGGKPAWGWALRKEKAGWSRRSEVSPLPARRALSLTGTH